MACDSTAAHVVQLFPNPRWSGNKLECQLPRSIGAFSQLEQLYTSNDRTPSAVSGQLPAEIGNLEGTYFFFFSSVARGQCWFLASAQSRQAHGSLKCSALSEGKQKLCSVFRMHADWHAMLTESLALSKDAVTVPLFLAQQADGDHSARD